MAIYTSCDVKEEFMKYVSSDVELAIMHMHPFKSILEKCNFHKKQEVVQLLLDDIQKEYMDLNTCTSTHGKKLKKDLEEAPKEVKSYIDMASKYFQDLLDESLVRE